MTQQPKLAQADASAPVRLAHDDTQLTCTACRAEGIERAAAARCRLCSLVLCSEHLSSALRRPRTTGDGCRHLFVAAGWLARVVERRVA